MGGVSNGSGTEQDLFLKILIQHAVLDGFGDVKRIDPATVGHWERGEHWPQKKLLNILISFFTSYPSSTSKSEE
jgi:hypothetical protein